MSYVLGEPTVQQYFDSNGDPLVNGTIEFYLSGTTTPTSIYSDSAGTAIGTSVTLNSSGAPANSGTAVALFFDTDITYKIVRKDSAGNEISPTIDPYIVAVAPTFTATPTGAVNRTLSSKLNDRLNGKDFGATGDGVTDDTVALQAALDAQIPVSLDPGIYRVTGELVFSDNSQLHGSGMFAGVRSNVGNTYDATIHTVILYAGSGGANSTVLRLSETAVGTAAGDLTPPDTDDLLGVQLTNLTVDAAGLAEYGIYCYRLIDNNIGPVAATRATEAGIWIQGSFTNTWDNLVAYSNEKNGIEVGTDRFTAWSSNESNVHNNTFIRPVARYNGTGKTYDGLTGTDVLEGHGLVWQLGRGNTVIQQTAEVNDGAGFVCYAASPTIGGPNKFVGGYTEGNMALVVSEARDTAAYNVVILYRENMRHWEFDSVYLSDSNSQDVVIVLSGDPPSDPEAYLTFRNCQLTNSSGGTLNIDSNTEKFRVVNCSPVPNYLERRPGVEEVSADGALDITSPITEITTTSAQVDLTLTTTGVRDNFIKTIVMVADGGFDAVVTPTTVEPSITTITFNSRGDSCQLMFLNSRWHVLTSSGAVLA